MNYQEFLSRKAISARPSGLTEFGELSPVLFPFQRTVVERAIRAGRYAMFLDTGLGKTLCQLEWARQMPGEVLILAPPAVAPQSVREGKDKLGMDVHNSKDGSVCGKVTITNYERIHYFDLTRFSAVVLDESSILKSFTGKTRNLLVDSFRNTPYRLACTATPSPNDHTELGNHAEFLGVMTTGQMQARWFVNDTGETGTWRLKGHAQADFWRWVATWAACVAKPSDAGGDDTPFMLPPITTSMHVVETKGRPNIDSGSLFGCMELSATNIYADKRATLHERVEKSAELASTNEPTIIWCESNDESKALRDAIPNSIEVRGADDPDEKEEKLEAFSRGDVLKIITKPSIAGFGLNWQHCAHVIFASLSFSYESFYQAIRRSWRFGQKRPVHVDVVIAESEQGVWRTVREKMEAHDDMKSAMRTAAVNSLNR